MSCNDKVDCGRRRLLEWDNRLTDIVVLIFLAVLFVFSYALKREYWKDIRINQTA